MEVEIKIVIPSMGRFTGMTTHKHVSNCIVCIPEAQLDRYKANYPNLEYVTHPDSVLGLSLKRQWIWQKFKNVFMLDDDLLGLQRLTAMSKESSRISPEAAYWIVQNVGNLAKLSGCYFFGFNNFVVPEHYHGHTPFTMKGYINGCGTGLLEEGLGKIFYNKEIKANEDYWISALNAFFNRKAFIDERFCCAQSGFANNMGGLSDIRTNDVEKKDFETLKRNFGEAIQIKNHGKYKSKHPYSKNLILPF